MRGSRPLVPSGFSLVEVIVVLAILAALGAIGVVAARPAFEMHAARAMRSLILQARAEAMWTGESIAVVELPSGRGLRAARMESPADCAAGQALASVDLIEYPGVRLTDGIRAGGLYWLGSGSGRSCAGGGVISDTLLLAGPRGTAAVIVSSLGRVRLERRP